MLIMPQLSKPPSPYCWAFCRVQLLCPPQAMQAPVKSKLAYFRQLQGQYKLPSAWWLIARPAVQVYPSALFVVLHGEAVAGQHTTMTCLHKRPFMLCSHLAP